MSSQSIRIETIALPEGETMPVDTYASYNEATDFAASSLVNDEFYQAVLIRQHRRLDEDHDSTVFVARATGSREIVGTGRVLVLDEARQTGAMAARLAEVRLFSATDSERDFTPTMLFRLMQYAAKNAGAEELVVPNNLTTLPSAFFEKYGFSPADELGRQSKKL